MHAAQTAFRGAKPRLKINVRARIFLTSSRAHFLTSSRTRFFFFAVRRASCVRPFAVVRERSRHVGEKFKKRKKLFSKDSLVLPDVPTNRKFIQNKSLSDPRFISQFVDELLRQQQCKKLVTIWIAKIAALLLNTFNLTNLPKLTKKTTSEA